MTKRASRREREKFLTSGGNCTWGGKEKGKKRTDVSEPEDQTKGVRRGVSREERQRGELSRERRMAGRLARPGLAPTGRDWHQGQDVGTDPGQRGGGKRESCGASIGLQLSGLGCGALDRQRQAPN